MLTGTLPLPNKGEATDDYNDCDDGDDGGHYPSSSSSPVLMRPPSSRSRRALVTAGSSSSRSSSIRRGGGDHSSLFDESGVESAGFAIGEGGYTSNNNNHVGGSISTATAAAAPRGSGGRVRRGGGVGHGRGIQGKGWYHNIIAQGLVPYEEFQANSSKGRLHLYDEDDVTKGKQEAKREWVHLWLLCTAVVLLLLLPLFFEMHMNGHEAVVTIPKLSPAPSDATPECNTLCKAVQMGNQEEVEMLVGSGLCRSDAFNSKGRGVCCADLPSSSRCFCKEGRKEVFWMDMKPTACIGWTYN